MSRDKVRDREDRRRDFKTTHNWNFLPQENTLEQSNY